MKDKIKSILLADYSKIVLYFLVMIPMMIGYVVGVILGYTLNSNGWNLIASAFVGAIVGSIPYVLALMWLVYRKNNNKSH